VLNIFYNPIYFKRKKVFLTKSFKHSIFYEVLVNFNYLLNLPINEKFITSGPQKRMNNLIKTFKDDLEISFNSIKYDNTYVVQYDDFGKSIAKKIIESENPKKKLIIGPLYNIEQDLEINDLTKKYSYIKKLVASDIAFKNVKEMDNNMDINNVVICPSGVIPKKEVHDNLKISKRENKCLIYFKKRPKEDLEGVINFLKQNNQKYEIFEYGKYNNKKLIEASKTCNFGIIMSRPESQGFGIQEIMACNLPLIVWDQKTNYYEHLELSGTTVTVWNDNCGRVVLSLQEIINIFDDFKNNLEEYNPAEIILEKLTFEEFNINLKKLFK